MALCSQIFNKSVKRGCSSMDFDSNLCKKMCLKSYKFPNAAEVSSSEDENSEDEQLNYKLNQIKAKRRASSRISFSKNSNVELSKYISQYSDDEDKQEDVSKSDDAKEEFKLIQVPKGDKIARSKCFEYLVGAIDEAWARYCDVTSCIEDEVYYSDDENKNNIKLMNDRSKLIRASRLSLMDSDYLDEDDKSEIIDNYSVNSTDLTDISDNYINQTKKVMRMNSMSVNSSNKSTNQYQKLKDRLTKAKYFLQDLVDLDNFNDIVKFWNRWDMIKYATIELVEDDDDDEIIESTIDDLECGRYFVN